MFLLILISTFIAVVWGHMLWKARKLPPGPMPIPLFGNGLQFAFEIYRTGSIVGAFRKWKKQYGPVFTFWMGHMMTVNICDFDTAQDLMVKKGQLFINRVVPFVLLSFRKGLGVIFSNNEIWAEQRRFALHSLKNFGLSRSIMEDRIMLETDYRTQELNVKIDNAEGEVELDVAHMLEITVGNIVNRMLFTERFTEDREKKFFELKGNMDKVVESASPILMLISELNQKLPYFRDRLAEQNEPIGKIVDFFDEQIKERLQEIEDGKRQLKDEPEDFVDAFLVEIKNTENEKYTSFTIESLQITLLDLWSAGQETTATTLIWAFAYLTVNPETIQPLHEELDEITQKNGCLSLSDRSKTPYLNAFITETMRCSSILPMNVWREASEDVTVGEYCIPKGTATVAQTSVIMRDEKIFPDGDKFIPQRYIDNPELEQYVVSFGMGKRACLGESLARAELYLILGNLVSRFNFRASTTSPPRMEAKTEMGAMRRANDYKLIVTKRNEK